MIIAVSMRVQRNSSYPEDRDAISHDWIRMLDALSVTPVLVPNTLMDPSAFLSKVGARGLILTGGNDLVANGDASADASMDRDRTESSLLDSAVKDGIPVLAVCRGLQLVNAHFGGTVERLSTSSGNHVAAEHRVQVTVNPLPGIRLDGIRLVNSFHRQGVYRRGVARNLEIFATAEDDLVEGLFDPQRSITAVQWHPERPNSDPEMGESLITSWLAQCG